MTFCVSESLNLADYDHECLWIDVQKKHEIEH